MSTPAPAQDYPDERTALVNRQLPEMQLAGPGNPLTAPRLPPEGLTAKERAEWRFGVTGNAIVTGGTGTLALHSTTALLEHGLSGVSLWDIHPSTSSIVTSTLSSLQSQFPSAKIVYQPVDVRSATAIHAALESTVREFGNVHILCCFAGIVNCVKALEMSFPEWQRVLDVNLTGSFLCAQAFAKHIEKQNDTPRPLDEAIEASSEAPPIPPRSTSSPGPNPSILFTASISAYRTNFPQPQCSYNSSKSGLLSLSRSLAAELSALGIRVNTISPGYMDTILNEGPGLERARNIWNERNPWGRMGDPWEITGPVVLLCSRAGRWINGTDVVVDGGALVF